MVGPPSDTRREGVVIGRARASYVSEVPVAQPAKQHRLQSTKAYSPSASTGADGNRPRPVGSAVALGQSAVQNSAFKSSKSFSLPDSGCSSCSGDMSDHQPDEKEQPSRTPPQKIWGAWRPREHVPTGPADSKHLAGEPRTDLRFAANPCQARGIQWT